MCTAFPWAMGRWRGRELLLPSQFSWQSKEAHQAAAGLMHSAGRGVLQASRPLWVGSSRARPRFNTTYTYCLPTAFLTTCWTGSALFIFCFSFPLHHTRHTCCPHQDTAFPFVRLCRRYWRHGVSGAAHLDPRPTQPYCCGASDLSSFFIFSRTISGAHAIGTS